MNIKNKRLIIVLIFQVWGVIVWFCSFGNLSSRLYNVLCLPGYLVLYPMSYIEDPGIKIIASIAYLVICPLAQIVAYSFIGYGVSRLIFPNKKVLPDPEPTQD